MPLVPWEDDAEEMEDDPSPEFWKDGVYPTSEEVWEEEDWPEPDPDEQSEYNLFRKQRDEEEGG